MRNDFKGKKVLILGLGVNQGGAGAALFFASQGSQVRVTDLKTAKELKPSLDQLKRFKKIEYILGQHREEDIDWADLIIRNPAIRPTNEFLQYAVKAGKQLEMDLGIFLDYVSKDQLIGVTGTKGKSTTASLIYEVLKSGKQNVILAGNIGKSVLDVIPYIKKNSLIILELSSFQLQAFEQHQFSPKIAVITNIFPDHLNYHGSMRNYIEAKRAITKFQTKQDILLIKKSDKVTDRKDFLSGLEAKIIRYAASDLPKEFNPQLKGLHNLDNIAAALALAKALNLKKDLFLKTLEKFSGIDFRMQLIYDKNGLRIYNDSTATNPTAAIQALKSFPNSIVIVGGMNKNLDYKEFAKALEKYPKDVLFIEGDATEEIRKHLKFKTFPTFNNLEKILKDIKMHLDGPENIILFSPGATSFNLFQNEFDRGKKFNEAVKKVFK